jgi:PAS domain S-box-containing protein
MVRRPKIINNANSLMGAETPASLVMTPSELRRLNWALAAFARSSAALMRFTSFEGLVPQICDAIVGDNDYLLAMVGLAEAGATKPVRLIAAAGLATAYAEGLNLSWSDDVAEGQGPTGRAIRTGEPLIVRDSLEDQAFSPWRDRAQAFGIRSSVTVPFASEDGIVGVLVVYASRPDAFGEQEMDVFAKLAHELAFARSVEKARSDLIRSEARYRLLAENTLDLLLAYDLEGRITYVAPSIRRYGLEPDDMIGQPFGGMVHPDHRQLARQKFQDALAGKPDQIDDFQAQVSDGRWVWFEGQLAPIRDDAGKVIGLLATHHDVSARKAAEQALREVSSELTRVARISSLGAFSASLAHEINQPLAALLTNTDVALSWLSRDPPDLGKLEQAIGRIARDARRAGDIIDRMRLMMTKGPSKATVFDVNAAIGEVLALTQVERSADVGATIELSSQAPMISGDRIQIQQVMVNLIHNAIEAMQATPAQERRLIIRSNLLEGDQVLVEVEDRGPGLDPAQADRIFQHLFTTKAGGTGLGLSISKSIIESHGGRLWAEPATPKGASFCFKLPLAARS